LGATSVGVDLITVLGGLTPAAPRKEPAMTDTSPSEQMFRMITGLWVSQAIGTVADLGIADALAGGAGTAAEVAARVSADERSVFRLLRACATVGIVTHDEQDRFALTPLGATLRSDAAGSMRGMAIAQTAPGHWLPWGNLRAAVRSGERQTPRALGAELFDYYGQHGEEAAAFMGAMDDLSRLVAAELVRLAGVDRVSLAVDVGGAQGTLVTAVLGASTAGRGVLLDLQHVVPGAKAAIAKAGLASRCEVVAGDFFTAVPAGGDLYLLKQILHDWDDDQAGAILASCARAMRPDGRVLIVEMVIPDDRRPTAAQFMDLNMLVLVPGRERTVREYRTLLARSGLTMRRVIETHSPFQIIEATR
jgi:hypothetical protein